MEITQEELIMVHDLICFLRAQDRGLIVPYKNMYCSVFSSRMFYNGQSNGVEFELGDNFGNEVLKFFINGKNHLIHNISVEHKDISEAINAIKKNVTIVEYNVSSNIYNKMSLNSCELNNEQFLFNYGKYYIEIEDCEGDTLVALICNERENIVEYPIGYILVYSFNEKLYFMFYDLEEGTNQEKIKLLVDGTMQNLITWCTT